MRPLIGCALVGLVGATTAVADLAATEPVLGEILGSTIDRQLSATPDPGGPDEDHDAMRRDRAWSDAIEARGGTPDNDATHYARGSTLIMHVFIDHAGGTWNATERSEAGAKAFLAKEFYLDVAPPAANLSFDNEDGTAFWYVTATVAGTITAVDSAVVANALLSIGVVDIDGDGRRIDDYSLGLQNWNGGWDNVILAFEPADLTGRAWASYGTSATAMYIDDHWSVWAHEWGHSFGSCDEYTEDGTCNDGIECEDTCQSWYLDEDYPNGNCQLFECFAGYGCLMIDNSQQACAFTKDHWSWGDDDGNGQLDFPKRISDFGAEHDILEIWNNGWYAHYTTTDAFAAHVSVPGWTIFGLRSPAGADHDLRLFGDSNQTYQWATSTLSGQAVDFIVADYHLNRPGVEHLKANRVTGPVSTYGITWDGNGDVIYPDGLPHPQNWIAQSIVSIFDVPLFEDEEITVTLDVTSGGLDMGMALFTSYGTTFFAGRPAAVWSADATGPGGTESHTYAVSGDDVYGLAVWSNNATSGSFTITIGPAPITLAEESPYLSSADVRLFNYDPGSPYWASVASRPDDGDAISLRLFDDAQHTIEKAASNEPGDELELIAVNYADDPINRDHIRIAKLGGTRYRTEWEQSPDVSGGYTSGDWVSTHVTKMWDVHLEDDQTYFFRQYHPAFSSLDTGLYLFAPGGDPSRTKSQAAADSDVHSSSLGEWFTHTATTTGFHGLNLVVNNQASDPYSIWWGPRITLREGDPRVHANEVVYALTPGDDTDWVVWGARPSPGTEVAAWHFATDQDYAGYAASSEATSGVNLLVSDRNHLPTEVVWTRFRREAGAGSIRYDFEGGSGENLPYVEGDLTTIDLDWIDGRVAVAYDLYLDGASHDPAFVEIHANVTSGDLDLGMALFGSTTTGGPFYQGTDDALVTANDFGDAGTEVLSYSSPRRDVFGLVIWNENEGSGTYQLVIAGSPILDAGSSVEMPTVVAVRTGPNPMRGPAHLELDLPADEKVRLTVYDVGGRAVRTLIDDHLAAGIHRVVWDGRDARGEMTGPGVYLVRVRAGSEVRTTKLVRHGS